MVNAVIVGTGDFAYALAHLFRNNNMASSGNNLEVTKPSIKRSGIPFHDTGVFVNTLDVALSNADIVILAIPANALKSFVPTHIALLKDKILVDSTNSTKKGEDLASLVQSTGVRHVKAFNDLGAIDVLSNKVTNKKKYTTKLCSPQSSAAEAVRQLAEQSFGLQVMLVPYERYNDIAGSQSTLGKEWLHSTYIMLVTFCLTEFYAVWRYNVEMGYAWYHLPIQVTNKAICWTAITGFALTQLPGVLARIRNHVTGNLKNMSRTLLWALGLRKELGLISLWFLCLHVLMSLLIFNPAYYGKFFVETTGNSKLNVIGETSLLFAILGTMLYSILGISSLPSVGENMTSAQWQLIYGPLAWSALSFGTIHVLVMGVKGWDDQHKWPGGMPPITMTSTLIPMLVIFLKVIEVSMATFLALTGRRTSTSCKDDLKSIRTLIRKESVPNDFQDDDENTGSGYSSTSSTAFVSFNKKTGDCECQFVSADHHV